MNGLTPTTDVIGDNRSTQTFERTKENTISILTLTRFVSLHPPRKRERERGFLQCWKRGKINIKRKCPHVKIRADGEEEEDNIPPRDE